MEEIARGAEAVLYADGETIVKRRLEKGYRVKELDNSLRLYRTRREAKVLDKLPAGIARPALLKVDEERMEIVMSNIPGKKVRDVLEDNLDLCVEIGEKIAAMHDAGIIHGDLTTSNMILSEELYFIDFGLSFFSRKLEDRAVDLHLLKRALSSKHYSVADKAFALVLKGYRKSSDYHDVMARLEKVEGRGRYKQKSTRTGPAQS